MEIEEDDSPPESTAVGNSWQEFERAVLPSIAEDLGPGTLGVSQFPFYFGVLAALGIVQAVIEGAEGEGAIELALDGLRDEVEGSIEASGEVMNQLLGRVAALRAAEALVLIGATSLGAVHARIRVD